ncbi:hypothetical protein HYH03_004142 [Edaphochlamys debaryana]|uniref:Uncharacterized protein n=1 Tax=Edaphochlamys debaryana TaxID=47281 RepID=A0A836C2C8_9CHLO|nr:hypothetical protein HYH03_004142 [Edaphochlamys debaryana]|eukprot:KAG2497876.1 hypothetical protein HYH03_004142 [Edaphochlamys debaryana]
MSSHEPSPSQLRCAAAAVGVSESNKQLWRRSGLTMAKLLAVTLRRAEERTATARRGEDWSQALESAFAAAAVAELFSSYVDTTVGVDPADPELSEATSRHLHGLVHAVVRSHTLQSAARLMARWTELLGPASPSAGGGEEADAAGGAEGAGAGSGAAGPSDAPDGGAARASPSPQASSAAGEGWNLDRIRVLGLASNGVTLAESLAKCVRRLMPPDGHTDEEARPKPPVPAGGLLKGCAGPAPGAGGVEGGGCDLRRELLSALEESRLLDHAARLAALALASEQNVQSLGAGHIRQMLSSAAGSLTALAAGASKEANQMLAHAASHGPLLYLLTDGAVAEARAIDGGGAYGAPESAWQALWSGLQQTAPDDPADGLQAAAALAQVCGCALPPARGVLAPAGPLGSLLRRQTPAVLVRVAAAALLKADNALSELGRLRLRASRSVASVLREREGQAEWLLQLVTDSLRASLGWLNQRGGPARVQPQPWWEAALRGAEAWQQLTEGAQATGQEAAMRQTVVREGGRDQRVVGMMPPVGLGKGVDDHTRLLKLRPRKGEVAAEAVPPCVAAALAAGYPARVERILRRAYTADPELPARVDPLYSVLGLVLDSTQAAMLIRFGPPREVASLLASTAKVLRAHAAAVERTDRRAQSWRDKAQSQGRLLMLMFRAGHLVDSLSAVVCGDMAQGRMDDELLAAWRGLEGLERCGLAAFGLFQLLPALLTSLLRLLCYLREGMPAELPPVVAAEVAEWRRLLFVEADALGTLAAAGELLRRESCPAPPQVCEGAYECLSWLCSLFPEEVAARLEAEASGATAGPAYIGGPDGIAAWLVESWKPKRRWPRVGVGKGGLQVLAAGRVPMLPPPVVANPSPVNAGSVDDLDAGSEEDVGDDARGPPPCGPLQAAYALLLTCGDLRCTNLEGDSEAELALGPAEGAGVRGPLHYCARCGAGRAGGARRGGRR